MRRALAIVSACTCALLMHPTRSVLAQGAVPEHSSVVAPAPDDIRAGMCDGFDGPAFTFCVALCEARNCDTRDANDARCTVLRRGFARVTKGASPPCEVGGVAARSL
jgi:hypothetical protein